MADLASFLTAFIPSLIVFVVFVAVFSVARKKHPLFYEPKRLLLELDKGLVAPPPVGDGCLGRCFSVTDEEIVKHAGLDAFVFLTFLRTALKIFGVLTLLLGAVLLPVYAHGEMDLGDVDMFTLGNIENESDMLWAPWVMTWVCSVVVYALFYKAYAHVTSVCMEHRHVGGPERHTIIVFEIPEDHQTDEKVKEFFEQFFPGEVRAVHCVMAAPKLRKVVDEHRACKKALDHCEAEFAAKGERPMHRPLTAPQAGKVDSIEWHSKEYDRLCAELQQERGKQLKGTECAFVSFTSAMTAAKAAQGYYAPVGWRVEEAPEPRDVYWPNLAIPEKQKQGRRTVVTAVTCALIFLWTIPVAAISALTTLENLKSVGFIETIVESSVALEKFLTGFLPTLALIIFMALLPMILLKLSTQEGIHSWSLLQKSVLEKLFVFEVVNVFLVTALASALFQSIEDIADDPTSTPKLLGKAIPQVSTFFISYVAMQAFGRYGMELVRIVPLILGQILGKKKAFTDREKNMLSDPGMGHGFGLWSAPPLLIFTLCIIYSVLAPFILPFATMFFAIALLVFTHNLVWVYRPMYQFNGRLWPVVWGRAVLGLLFMQLTMIGVMGLKYAYVQSPLLFPLPIITLVFRHNVNKKFYRLSQETPFKALLNKETVEDISVLDTAYLHVAQRPEMDHKVLPTEPVFLCNQVQVTPKQQQLDDEEIGQVAKEDPSSGDEIPQPRKNQVAPAEGSAP